MLQRTTRRTSALLGSVAEFMGRRVRAFPAMASAGCAVVGTVVLWGAGWAWLVAAGFLLLLAREVN